jgi:hypothetical protein
MVDAIAAWNRTPIARSPCARRGCATINSRGAHHLTGGTRRCAIFAGRRPHLLVAGSDLTSQYGTGDLLQSIVDRARRSSESMPNPCKDRRPLRCSVTGTRDDCAVLIGIPARPLTIFAAKGRSCIAGRLLPCAAPSRTRFFGTTPC